MTLDIHKEYKFTDKDLLYNTVSGNVYKCTWVNEQIQRDFAIKIIKREKAGGCNESAKFICQELRLL